MAKKRRQEGQSSHSHHQDTIFVGLLVILDIQLALSVHGLDSDTRRAALIHCITNVRSANLERDFGSGKHLLVAYLVVRIA